jgi:hypothetical protein
MAVGGLVTVLLSSRSGLVSHAQSSSIPSAIDRQLLHPEGLKQQWCIAEFWQAGWDDDGTCANHEGVQQGGHSRPLCGEP